MPTCEAPEVCRAVTRTREMPASEQGGRKEPTAKKFFSTPTCALWHGTHSPLLPTIFKRLYTVLKKEKKHPHPRSWKEHGINSSDIL